LRKSSQDVILIKYKKNKEIKMSKKCLILYATHTGNTEKVAARFKIAFERHGWTVDSVKLNQKSDLMHPTYDIKDYDFLCVGSGIAMHLPFDEILKAVKFPRDRGLDPKQDMAEPPSQMPPEGAGISPGSGKVPGQGGSPPSHHRIVFGPDSKKAVVFVTYSGFDLGPKEAVPSLELLALEVEHLEIEVIGKFSCLGKFIPGPTPETFWGDIRDRPNEYDLMKAEIFIEDKLAEMKDRYNR